MQKEFLHCKFLREILKLIKGAKNKENQDIEAGDDSSKKQFTKVWIPGEIRYCRPNQKPTQKLNF